MSLKYHLGCGAVYRSGYINVDFPQSKHTTVTVKADEYLDIRTMSFPSDVMEIYSHHVFEHFGLVDSLALLIKWTSALSVDGSLVIGVPDPVKIVEGLKKLPLPKQAIGFRLLFGTQEAEWGFHINGWTPELLGYLLTEFGYKNVVIERHAGPSIDFPNCWFSITGVKSGFSSVSILTAAQDFLKQYTVEKEKKLYKVYCDELLERIRCWM